MLASKDKCNVINMAFVNGTVLKLTYNNYINQHSAENNLIKGEQNEHKKVTQEQQSSESQS